MYSSSQIQGVYQAQAGKATCVFVSCILHIIMSALCFRLVLGKKGSAVQRCCRCHNTDPLRDLYDQWVSMLYLDLCGWVFVRVCLHAVYLT